MRRGSQPSETPFKAPELQTIEEVETIKEDATDAAKREKRKQILSSTSAGGRSTILSGIQTQLKKRLGE